MTAPRRAWIPLAVLAALVFAVASAALARALSAGSAERNAAIEQVRDQPMARGGDVRVLRVDGGGFSLRERTTNVRVVWNVDGGLPVVQCARVSRTGDLASGFDVSPLSLSRPIDSESGCPTG